MIIKRNKKILISVLIILLTLILFLLIIKMVLNKETIETNIQNTKLATFKKAEIDEINLDEIIEENLNKVLYEEITTEEIDLEYTTVYKNNNNLAKGQIQVLQEGRDGKQTVVNKKTYQNGQLLKEEQTGRTITKSSIDKIVEIGTNTNVSNHKIKKGDKLYVTSYTLNLMQDKDISSNKITTLKKDDEVKLLETSDEWYKISYKNYIGWADKNCLIYKEITTLQTESNENKSKEKLMSELSKNMDLTKISGLSLEQFKKVLSNNSNDTNKIFENNAEYFYYIEKQYNINGIFVAAVGIHESAWGTSKISLNKKNLFGYGASDSNPYENAYKFNSYSEGIDMIARVFVKYYLNPKGTKIYDNEVATGKFYLGNTIESVNKKYATDKNWHNSVYKWMEYLYKRI